MRKKNRYKHISQYLFKRVNSEITVYAIKLNEALIAKSELGCYMTNYGKTILSTKKPNEIPQNILNFDKTGAQCKAQYVLRCAKAALTFMFKVAVYRQIGNFLQIWIFGLK